MQQKVCIAVTRHTRFSHRKGSEMIRDILPAVRPGTSTSFGTIRQNRRPIPDMLMVCAEISGVSFSSS
jgi:hypothetical protein